MMGLPLAFTEPLLLIGLVSLPVLWWLLRVRPPRPRRIEFVEPEGFGVITAGRAESWAQDYTARLALHRDQIRAQTSKLDWLFTTHATDRSAAELLLFLHAGMQVSKSGARTTTIKAGPAA